jgi:hypothetical protein
VATMCEPGPRHSFSTLRLTHFVFTNASCSGPSLQRLAVGHFQQLTRSERFWNAPPNGCTRARSNILRLSGVRA